MDAEANVDEVDDVAAGADRGEAGELPPVVRLAHAVADAVAAAQPVERVGHGAQAIG